MRTDATGQVIFQGLQPGTYSVTETQAPQGYQPTAPYNNVVVKPGITTVIEVVDKKSPPPPDTGSVRVVKFYCTATKGGEFTQIFDSSNPGAQQLKDCRLPERCGDVHHPARRRRGRSWPGPDPTRTAPSRRT